MRTRILVGILFVPLVLLPIFLGPNWSAALFLLLALVGGYEFFQLMTIAGYRPVAWLGMCWIALLVATGWNRSLLPLNLVLPLGLIALLIFSLFEAENPLGSWLATSTGAIYLGLLLEPGGGAAPGSRRHVVAPAGHPYRLGQ